MYFKFEIKKWLFGFDFEYNSKHIHFGPFSIWWAKKGTQLYRDLQSIRGDKS